MKNVTSPDLQIHRITGMEPHDDGTRILVRADAELESGRTELEIAVTTDLVPSMALALLATTAQTRAVRDELDPALQVLAAAVVRSSSDGSMRLQLLFDKGVVLPLEMPLEAGKALSAGLLEYLNSSQRRLAARRDQPKNGPASAASGDPPTSP